MIYLILGIIGMMAGGYLLDRAGAVPIGGAIGLLTAALLKQKAALNTLQNRLASIEASLARPSDAEHPATSSRPKDAKTPMARQVDHPALSNPAAASSDSTSKAPPNPRPVNMRAIGQKLRLLITGGNLMVRIGVVVLLFGFAFLVKYTAARDLIPLEWRLTGAFAAGIGLLGAGWRLRRRRTDYAMALQGGGIGVMYLTLFAAARLLHLVPLPLALGVMVALVVFSGLLAVWQNAVSLAVLGAAGGFMAPVLLSTGTGSHVMLFGYYALLNAGIFGIAWFKAWRGLNLLGFVFTFGIGSAWGVAYYRPAYFASTEPFLVLFFAFYLTIAVLHGWKQPPRLKGYIDGTLVFGLPLIAFGLQAALVKDMAYGLAFSAMAMGLIYLTLATALWRYQPAGMRLLTEAFLAFGVVLGSLAIPLALSGFSSAMAWALEGAGMVWVGLRQHRWMARNFGLLLQFGAGAMLLAEGAQRMQPSMGDRPFISGALIAVAALFSAFHLTRRRKDIFAWERFFTAIMLTWGLLWWIGAGFYEIGLHLGSRHELAAALGWVGISATILLVLHRRLDWRDLRWPLMGMLPCMAAAGLAALDSHWLAHPLQDGWLAAWPASLAIHIWILARMERSWPALITTLWHVAGSLLMLFLLSWETAWALDRLARGAIVWPMIAWGALPALAMTGLGVSWVQRRWPIASQPSAYRQWLPVTLVIWLTAWSLFGILLTGDARPLPYLPLINPLDLMQIFVFITIIQWQWRGHPLPARLPKALPWALPMAGIFIWLTAVVARTVHQWGHVAYKPDALMQAAQFQTAISVLWGTLAMIAMIAAHRRCLRAVWFIGAGLLAVVVLKLFFVDLSETGAISRIISFLAVGGLMLIIGFFTPLPPANKTGETPS